jgi:protein tyrosine phosphatase
LKETNRWLFTSVREVRALSDVRLYEYNRERPHGSLGVLMPAQFEQQHWQNNRSVKKESVRCKLQTGIKILDLSLIDFRLFFHCIAGEGLFGAFLALALQR